ADDRADPLGQNVRTVRLAQVDTDFLDAAASLADFGDDAFGLLLAVAVVDKYLSADLGQSQGTGTADATRGAGNECGFSRKIAHVVSLDCGGGFGSGMRWGSYSDKNIDTCRTNRSGYWYCEPWLASG